MRWFKHMTASADDEKLSRLKDAYGLEGYGFWWSVVEVVAEKVGADGKTSVEFSPKKWGSLLGISPKKFQTLAELCATLGLFSLVLSENRFIIDIPNILKFRDEYTEKQHKKSGQERDKLPPSRARSSEADTEAEEEKSTNTLGSTLTKGARERFKVQGRGAPDSQSSPALLDDPGIAFQELREFYNENGRAEPPLAGFSEFKQAKAARSWPGESCIYQAIAELSKRDDEWKRGFAPGLARFIREKGWEKKPTAAKARAAPPCPSTYAQAQDMERRQRAARVLQTQETKHGDVTGDSGRTGQGVHSLAAANS